MSKAKHPANMVLLTASEHFFTDAVKQFTLPCIVDFFVGDMPTFTLDIFAIDKLEKLLTPIFGSFIVLFNMATTFLAYLMLIIESMSSHPYFMEWTQTFRH